MREAVKEAARRQRGSDGGMIKCHLSRMLGERKQKMASLAAAAGVSKQTILGLYHESVKGISFRVLGKLCAALECQPGDLLEYVEDRGK